MFLRQCKTKCKQLIYRFFLIKRVHADFEFERISKQNQHTQRL